jgi:tRNA-splicing endonuclease subunit Sen34
MPEEAYLLVTNWHAYIVDDVVAHRGPFLRDEEDKRAYLADLRNRGLEYAKEKQRKAELKKPMAQKARKLELLLEPLFITPTTSYPPLKASPSNPSRPLPPIPKSYSLFQYLHSKGYYMSPGLRFGCIYTCYPDDPLRYHR